ncbi:MAG TPA: hypothetical protein VN580_08285, partial [Clostridia bacterium]|nr:hypothetical protein [Clostridia bacterium]
MRLIARFSDKRQIGALVDSLKNAGFDRKDMIISDLADAQVSNTVEEAAEELQSFAGGSMEPEGENGIIVAVKTPKHESTIVRSLMEQSGAV